MPITEHKDNPEEDESLRKFLSGGAEIAGGAVGGAIGFLAGGPVGATVAGAASVAAAKALTAVGKEVSDRLLGPREAVRVGGVLALASDEIARRIEQGETLRSDGFFDAVVGQRSNAEEVAESVLLKSQREPEEHKLIYMGKLLSNASFNAEISAALAHHLIKAGEELTYRQLCLLSLAARKRASLRSSNYRGQSHFDMELYQVLYELFHLYQKGYLNFGGSVAFGPTDVIPGSMEVQGIGADLYNEMGLSRIPEAEFMPLIKVLK